jgi:hypothetical protein
MTSLVTDHDHPEHPRSSEHETHAHAQGERATTLVLALTIVTMIAEVAAGWWTGSMALLADGWHMGMHAAAMGVSGVRLSLHATSCDVWTLRWGAPRRRPWGLCERSDARRRRRPGCW